jgi:hypothetical protein
VRLVLHANAENRLDEEFMRARGRSCAARDRCDAALGARQRRRSRGPAGDRRPRIPAQAEGRLTLFAHPERCAEFERPGRAEEVVRLGAALQLNVGARRRLRKARAQARGALPGKRPYAVAATDLHRRGIRTGLARDAIAMLASAARAPKVREAPPRTRRRIRRRGGPMRRTVQVLAGLAISGVAIWLTPVARISAPSGRQCGPPSTGTSRSTWSCSGSTCRTIRWESCSSRSSRSPSPLNAVAAVGFMALFVLPFRLGEFARPYLIAERPRLRSRRRSRPSWWSA